MCGQGDGLSLRQAEFQGQNLGPAGEAGRRETDPELVISNGKKISNEERFPFGFILMYKRNDSKMESPICKILCILFIGITSFYQYNILFYFLFLFCFVFGYLRSVWEN